MTCDNSNDDGCRSCMASLFQSPRRMESRRESPGDDAQSGAESDTQCNPRGFSPVSGSPFVLLTLMAFVLPTVVSIVIVQAIESRDGSVAAAISGVLAAGLTVATSVGIVKRLTCRSAFRGAGR